MILPRKLHLNNEPVSVVVCAMQVEHGGSAFFADVPLLCGEQLDILDLRRQIFPQKSFNERNEQFLALFFGESLLKSEVQSKLRKLWMFNGTSNISPFSGHKISCLNFQLNSKAWRLTRKKNIFQTRKSKYRKISWFRQKHQALQKAHCSNSEMLTNLTLPVSGSPIRLLKQEPDTPIAVVRKFARSI
jgi:hypothetical protein